MPTTVKFSLIDLQNEIQKHQNPLRASNSQRFFKTAYGQYGHGDIFIGLTNPISRQIANTYQSIMLSETEKLLQSPVHEHRLIALLILILSFKKVIQRFGEQFMIYTLGRQNISTIGTWLIYPLHK